MKHQANFSKKNKGSSPFLNSGKHPSRQGFTSKTSSRGIKQRLNKEDSYDEPSLLPQDYIHLINNRQVINDVHCYIDDSIEHTSYYRNLIHYLNEMTELDKLTIWIDSPGGSLDSALAIINAMKNTEGNVLVVISGDCSSAASLIALSADNLSVSENARMLIHNGSYGTGFSKAGDIELAVSYNSKRIKNVMKDAYKDFLTDEELELLYIGKDFYLDHEELTQRLEKRQEKIVEEHEKQKAASIDDSCDKLDCENCKCFDDEEYDEDSED